MTKGAERATGAQGIGSTAFPGILPETRDALESLCRVRVCPQGQTVVREGDSTDFVGCMVSGILRMQKTLTDGRQHIVGLLVEGDMFGRVFGGAVEFSVEAATDVRFCAFPRAEFETLLMRSPDLDRAVMLNMLTELDRARDWMIILSSQKITNRVAGFLLLMISRFSSVDHIVEATGRGIDVRIPVGREDLAHLLGTRPESVSRALHALQDDGDILIVQPNLIRVLDFNALARKAGEGENVGAPSVRDILSTKRPFR